VETCLRAVQLCRMQLLHRLTQAAERFTGQAEDVFKSAGEMACVVNPQFSGDFLDACVRFMKSFCRQVHLQSHKELVWRLMIVATKQTTQISGV
jgi:hypothetical protein